MPLSKRAILRGDRAENRVLNFEPRMIDVGTPQVALEVLERQRKSENDFHMSDVMRAQTGVDKIEAQDAAEKIEKQVLARLQEIQESSYQQAYQLGLEEGRKKAFEDTSEELRQKMKSFDEMLVSISKIKMELVEQNEAQLINLLFQTASKLAFHKIEEEPAIMATIIRKIVESIQADEEVIVSINPSHKEFMETISDGSKEFEFMKKIKLETQENISKGGCVVETNYGQIDAQAEERVKKLWEQLSENLPKIKNKVGIS